MTVTLIFVTAALSALVVGGLVAVLAHAIHADRLLAHRHTARVASAADEREPARIAA